MVKAAWLVCCRRIHASAFLLLSGASDAFCIFLLLYFWSGISKEAGVCGAVGFILVHSHTAGVSNDFL